MVARRTRRRPVGPSSELAIGRVARYDLGRGVRTGAPEVVLAEGKSVDHLLELVHRLAQDGHQVMISRPTRAQRRALDVVRAQGLPLVELAGGRLYRLDGRPSGRPVDGRVAVLTAGTADIPIAEEAVELLRSAGASVVEGYDVGVAGIHRLQRQLRVLERAAPSVYLVFAGREGALPTVVAGLVRAPVVGVPTSVGYGRGGRGAAALNAMLQSCAPLTVVNIDAAIPAALFALQLLAANGRRAGPGTAT